MKGHRRSNPAVAFFFPACRSRVRNLTGNPRGRASMAVPSQRRRKGRWCHV